MTLLKKILDKVSVESKYLKAHAAGLAAGYALLLADVNDGHLSTKDIAGIVLAAAASWGIVYKLPNS